MRAAAVREIRAHPLRFLATRLAQFPELWLTSHTGNVRGVSDSFGTYWSRGAFGRVLVKSVLLILNTGLIAAGLYAMARALLRHPTPAITLVASPIAVVAGVHLMLFATARYQVPMMPFILAFAATLTAPAAESR
jgi:hypothetical protein